MSKSDQIEATLSDKWLCARQIAEQLSMPISTVTGALSTLFKYDADIECEFRQCVYHNRPVKHYRIRS